MKRSYLIVVAFIIVAVIGWQTYMIFSLHQRVKRLTEPTLPGEDLFGVKPPNDDFFNDDHWDPYREFQRMQQEMERTFGDAFSRFHLNRGFSSLTRIPPLDLKEKADRYIVKMDIPGADISSLSVNLKDQQLSISVKTEQNSEDESKKNQHNFQRRERFSGTFHRSITLPGPVNGSAMKSDYKDGVLIIVIPKA